MDTATHIAIGIGLTALATQDPAMSHSMTATATTLIAGSLIRWRYGFKIKNNATYISHHRGITFHTLYDFMANITCFYNIRYLSTCRCDSYMDVGSVSGLFTCFVDIFNSYGTQALRPISNKWIQLGVINTFDPIIF